MKTIDMLHETITRIGVTQDEMAKTLVRIEADIAYHIKRTDILEERLVVNWKTIASFAAVIASVGSAVYYLTQVL